MNKENKLNVRNEKLKEIYDICEKNITDNLSKSLKNEAIVVIFSDGESNRVIAASSLKIDGLLGLVNALQTAKDSLLGNSFEELKNRLGKDIQDKLPELMEKKREEDVSLRMIR